MVGYQAISQSFVGIEESFQTAQQAADRGDYTTAIAALERVLILDPTLDNIRLELGVLYLQVGNTGAAEVLIRQALKSSDAPPEVRSRAQVLLVEATAANRRLRFGGSLTFGLISDSNANSGPAANALGPNFVISAESTQMADLSAFISAELRARLDLGFQAGHLLAVDTGFYWRAYQNLTNLNLAAPSISVGVDLNMTNILGRPADLLLRWNETGLWRDGEDFLFENGPTATLRLSPGPNDYAEVSIGNLQQDYRPTDTTPANNIRDGRRAFASVFYSRPVSSSTTVTFGGGYVSKSADEGFEAFKERYLSFGLQHSFDNPFQERSTLLAGLNLRRSWIEYDQADPEIDPNLTQSDDRWSVSGSLAFPFSDQVSLLTEVGYVDQSSNYALDSYENSYALISLTRQF
ncbi:MAG: tetratricopeptide repeat protein [Bacteroidota bacterium]